MSRPTVGGIKQCCIRPSVWLSVSLTQNGEFYGYGYYRTLVENSILEVENTKWLPEVSETTTKLSPAPIQKHSTGGCTCTIDMPPSNCHRRGAGTQFAARSLKSYQCLVKHSIIMHEYRHVIYCDTKIIIK